MAWAISSSPTIAHQCKVNTIEPYENVRHLEGNPQSNTSSRIVVTIHDNLLNLKLVPKYRIRVGNLTTYKIFDNLSSASTLDAFIYELLNLILQFTL